MKDHHISCSRRESALLKRPTMTFVAAFYNFTIELNHVDRGIFTTFRVKVPHHELESIEHFFATVVAYCHSYTPELSFSHTASSDTPALSSHDAVGELQTWIAVGPPEKRPLELSLKQNPQAVHTVYFYQEEDLPRFCHYLRGSTSNWIKNVTFYHIEDSLLTQVAEIEDRSPTWNISFIDGTIYLTVKSLELESTIEAVDIWDAFQDSLKATS